jgi:hypothetical protein
MVMATVRQHQRDGSHMTTTGSRLLGKRYLAMRRNPLKGLLH